MISHVSPTSPVFRFGQIISAWIGFSSVALIATTAHASVVLDQQYVVDGAFPGFHGFSNVFADGHTFRRVQTFTVGVAGTLSEVDLSVEGTPSFSAFNILSTVGGTPTTTVAASGTYLYTAGRFARFSVSLPVTIGEVLGIEAWSPFGGWDGLKSGTYDRGGDFALNSQVLGLENFTFTGGDSLFKTFVTVVPSVPSVPLPASAPILSMALLALGAVGYGARHKKAAAAA